LQRTGSFPRANAEHKQQQRDRKCDVLDAVKTTHKWTYNFRGEWYSTTTGMGDSMVIVFNPTASKSGNNFYQETTLIMNNFVDGWNDNHNLTNYTLFMAEA
jgi:hypothetical protein